jgi:hypothetical protein
LGSVSSLVSEKKIFEMSANQSILLALAPGSHVEYPTGTKNRNFVEDHPRNIPAKFGSNWLLDGPLHTLGFLFDMKFKMAATARLSLTLDPMGKMFQNASSLKSLGQLKPNCP